MHHFENIVVDSENHGYKIGEQNLISATTLVSRIKPDFDKDGVSKRVAERDGITQEELKELGLPEAKLLPIPTK